MKILLFWPLCLGLFCWGCVEKAPTPPRVAAALPPPVAEAPAGADSVWPSDAPTISARSALLLDARTGRVLWQKNADEPRPVASTQKLLTGLLVSRKGQLDAMVTIAPEDTRVEPSKLGLRAGERYPRRWLLQAMLVRSANDAAAALARDAAGSQEAFTQQMNQLAWQLGARSSYFANPHGLPAQQWSTARDIARVAFYAYRDPELRRIMQMPQMVFPFNTGRVVVLNNTNKLLGRSAVYNGMKTGYTLAAGRCLVSSADWGDRELILVQLGSSTRTLFDDAERVLRWGAGRNSPSGGGGA